MLLITEMEVKSFARCNTVQFTVLNISPQYEIEEQRRMEDEKNVPEFVRVKENLRRIQLTG